MLSIRRVVTVAAVVGLALYAWTRWRRNLFHRLFLYEAEIELNPFARAAVATISPNHFTIESEYTYGAWTYVTSAASGKKKWLLFYSVRTGSVATALID